MEKMPRWIASAGAGVVLALCVFALIPEHGWAQQCSGSTCWRLCSGTGSTEYFGATSIPVTFGTTDVAATAATAITSTAVSVDLKNRTNCGGGTTSGSITLVLPTSCDIRSSVGGPIVATINAADLRYVIGGTELTPGATPTAAGNYSIALRILASANVGATGGEISCTGGTAVPASTPNSSTASFSVSGTRVKMRWENSSSVEITTLPLTFGGYAETTAGVNVDSDLGSPATAKIAGSATTPATVTINRPTGCSIGGNAVSNANVALVSDLTGTSTATTAASVSSPTTTTGTLRNFQPRFVAAGNHGQQSGAVTRTNGSLVATAGTQTATLTLGAVGGSVLARPMRQNASNTEVSTLAFDFTSFAGTTASENVNSTVVKLKLVNAASYPASVTLTTPTGCSIGVTATTNSHVVLYTDAGGTYAEVPSGTLSISSGSLNNYVLRFRGVGGYGLLSGATACTAGSMTFTYSALAQGQVYEHP